MVNESRIGKQLVLGFPDWSEIRKNNQSLGYSLLNTILGIPLEELDRKVIDVGKSYFLTTSNCDVPGHSYVLDLGYDYSFTVDNADAYNPIYTNPTVSGQIGSIWYSITQATDNSLEELLLDVPDRWTYEEVASGINGVTLLSQPVSAFPISSSIPFPEVPNRLSIEVSGGELFLYKGDENELHRARVVITGTTAGGLEACEIIPFIYDEIKTTDKEWESITRVDVLELEPDTAIVTIKDFHLSQENRPDFYNLEFNDLGETTDIFWALEQNPNTGHWCLEKRTWAIDGFALRVSIGNEVGKKTLVSFELLDQGSNNITPLDLAIKPFSTDVYVVSSGELFVYDTDVPLPDRSLLTKKTDDPCAIIETSASLANIYQGDEVDLDLRFRRPIKNVRSHRLYYETPTGEVSGLITGTNYLSSSDFWVHGDADRGRLRATEHTTLSALGDYIFTLETEYTDDTLDIDQRIFSVLSKTPKAEYILSSLVPVNVSGIDFDCNNSLWLGGVDQKKYRLQGHKDQMVIDYKNKRLYFLEDYDLVKVV